MIPSPSKQPVDAAVKGIRHAKRRYFPAEDKMRIVLKGKLR